MTPAGGPLLEVHLLQMPVDLWGRSREHSDELQREFALMSMGQVAPAVADDGTRPVPTRLLELVRHMRAQYATASTAQEQELTTALDEGRHVLDDLVYRVPASAADACLQIASLFDEADDFCRNGEHLLTLATPPELVSFRRWFLGEFVRQAQGQPPTPWPEHAAEG